MELILVMMLALQALTVVSPPLSPGVYQTVAVGTDLIRTDTRTGEISRCTLNVTYIECVPVAPVK